MSVSPATTVAEEPNPALWRKSGDDAFSFISPLYDSGDFGWALWRGRAGRKGSPDYVWVIHNPHKGGHPVAYRTAQQAARAAEALIQKRLEYVRSLYRAMLNEPPHEKRLQLMPEQLWDLHRLNRRYGGQPMGDYADLPQSVYDESSIAKEVSAERKNVEAQREAARLRGDYVLPEQWRTTDLLHYTNPHTGWSVTRPNLAPYWCVTPPATKIEEAWGVIEVPLCLIDPNTGLELRFAKLPEAIAAADAAALASQRVQRPRRKSGPPRIPKLWARYKRTSTDAAMARIAAAVKGADQSAELSEARRGDPH